MARQVRSKMSWDEGSNNRIADRAGLSRIIRNILGINHRANGSTSSLGYGHIEGSRALFGFASVKEVETLLRTARALQ
jgi:hypothetical protein